MRSCTQQTQGRSRTHSSHLPRRNLLYATDLPNDVEAAHKEVNKRLKENEEKEKTVKETLKKLGEENKDQLGCLERNLRKHFSALNGREKDSPNRPPRHSQGFCAQKKFSELTPTVNTKMEGKALVLENDAADFEGAPPSKIVHSRFVKPFEEITKLYGLPNYNEVDPTPLMAITFPILVWVNVRRFRPRFSFANRRFNCGYANQG